MNLFAWNERRDTRVDALVLAHRWAFSYARTYEVWLRRDALWGIYHDWYDGPRCSLALGWIQFRWNENPWTGRCRKCMDER